MLLGNKTWGGFTDISYICEDNTWVATAGAYSSGTPWDWTALVKITTSGSMQFLQYGAGYYGQSGKYILSYIYGVSVGVYMDWSTGSIKYHLLDLVNNTFIDTSIPDDYTSTHVATLSTTDLILITSTMPDNLGYKRYLYNRRTSMFHEIVETSNTGSFGVIRYNGEWAVGEGGNIFTVYNANRRKISKYL